MCPLLPYCVLVPDLSVASIPLAGAYPFLCRQIWTYTGVMLHVFIDYQPRKEAPNSESHEVRNLQTRPLGAQPLKASRTMQRAYPALGCTVQADNSGCSPRDPASSPLSGRTNNWVGLLDSSAGDHCFTLCDSFCLVLCSGDCLSTVTRVGLSHHVMDLPSAASLHSPFAKLENLYFRIRVCSGSLMSSTVCVFTRNTEQAGLFWEWNNDVTLQLQSSIHGVRLFSVGGRQNPVA